MNIKQKSNVIILFLLVIIVVSVFAIIYLKNRINPTDELLQCIAEDSILYSSKTCSHCAEQKIILGDGVKYFNIIDVSEHPEVWEEMNLKGVPTWIIKGKEYVGVQSIKQLKEATGC